MRVCQFRHDGKKNDWDAAIFIGAAFQERTTINILPAEPGLSNPSH